MINHENRQGVFVVPTTPYADDGSVDTGQLSRRVDTVLAEGVSGILCLGATGEALSLSAGEREAVVRTVVDVAAGRAHVVAGCMSYVPAEVSAHMAQVAEWGADSAMVTPPFYGGLGPDAAVAALHPVMALAEMPVMVYNNPHSTGTDLLPQHLETLLEFESFWSVKDTSGAATRVRELCNSLGDEVEIFVGADGLALEGFTQGASGWVAASAWLLPRHCQQLWEHVREGRWSDAVALWNTLADPLSRIEGNPAFISLLKQALSSRGTEQGPARPPLPTAALEDVDALLAAIDAIEEVEHV